jgi:hypothetical protein
MIRDSGELDHELHDDTSLLSFKLIFSRLFWFLEQLDAFSRSF